MVKNWRLGNSQQLSGSAGSTLDALDQLVHDLRLQEAVSSGAPFPPASRVSDQSASRGHTLRGSSTRSVREEKSADSKKSVAKDQARPLQGKQVRGPPAPSGDLGIADQLHATIEAAKKRRLPPATNAAKGTGPKPAVATATTPASNPWSPPGASGGVKPSSGGDPQLPALPKGTPVALPSKTPSAVKLPVGSKKPIPAVQSKNAADKQMPEMPSPPCSKDNPNVGPHNWYKVGRQIIGSNRPKVFSGVRCGVCRNITQLHFTSNA